MGIETAFRFTPGTEEGLAMVHESSPHAGPLGPGGQNIHPHDLPISILDEKVAQNDLPLGRHKQEMLLPCLAVVLQHRARRLADKRDIVLERSHAAGADPGNVRQSSPSNFHGFLPPLSVQTLYRSQATRSAKVCRRTASRALPPRTITSAGRQRRL